MDSVTVNCANLLEKLKINQEAHRQQFEAALAGWRAEVLAALRRAVIDAEQGKRFRTSIQLPQPSDHTDDYKEIIQAVTWSTRDEITLTRSEFRQFVLDEWGWKHDFIATNSMYTQ